MAAKAAGENAPAAAPAAAPVAPAVKKKRPGKQARDRKKEAAAQAATLPRTAAASSQAAPSIDEAWNSGPLEDKTLTCKDCKYEFVFSASEQEYFRDSGLPCQDRVRCSWCTKAKKAKYEGDASADAPKRCYNCGKNGHISRNCPDAKKTAACYICGMEGHLAYVCPDAPPSDRRGAKCFNCGRIGHRSHECTRAQRAGVETSAPRSTKPCFAFAQGTCKWGDACRFAHES